MKKLSISLVAVLAISFAIFSAFTTTNKAKKHFSTTYSVLAAVPETVEGSEPNSALPADFVGNSSVLRDEVDENFINSVDGEYEDLEDYKSTEGITCDPFDDFVCIAYQTDNGATKTIVSLIEGSYSE